MWLYDNWKRPVKNWTWYAMVVWSVFVIVIGWFLMGAGVSQPRCMAERGLTYRLMGQSLISSIRIMNQEGRLLGLAPTTPTRSSLDCRNLPAKATLACVCDAVGCLESLRHWFTSAYLTYWTKPRKSISQRSYDTDS